MSIARCGARCDRVDDTRRRPTAWAASMIGARSGAVPSRFDAPGTVTHFVRSSMRSIDVARAAVARSPDRTARARARRRHRSAASRHGVMLASWSSLVPTIRSPGRSVAPTARRTANVSEVMFGPKHTPAGSAPRSCPTASRVRSSSRAHSSAAANGPPSAAVLPLAIQSVIAVMAESTICVPAGPSKRAHSVADAGEPVAQDEVLTDELRSGSAALAALARRLAARPIGSMWRPSRSPTSMPLSNRHAVALPVEAVGQDDLALGAGRDALRGRRCARPGRRSADRAGRRAAWRARAASSRSWRTFCPIERADR